MYTLGLIMASTIQVLRPILYDIKYLYRQYINASYVQSTIFCTCWSTLVKELYVLMSEQYTGCFIVCMIVLLASMSVYGHILYIR